MNNKKLSVWTENKHIIILIFAVCLPTFVGFIHNILH